ncbi:MAG: extracellular solute-binding protein, partial [Anaerolineae bacterium]|nr:extracellular solute-binding protein [Anaerolineae bacterium]
MRCRTHIGLLTCCLLLAVCCLLVTACDLPQSTLPTSEPEASMTDLSTAEPPPTAALPPTMTTIVFWEPYPLDRPEGQLLFEMARDFETATPGVRVEVAAKSGVLGVYEAILLQLQEGGELPDLAVAFPSSIAELAAQGLVAPLDGYVNDPELGLSDADLADIYSSALEAGRFPALGGQLLAFPFAHNAIGMWVNDSLLAQAGWKQPPATWAEFEQACFDVWAQTGVRCLAFVESVSVFDAWLYSRGGQQLSDDGTRATFNSSAGVESLALLRRLMDAGLAWRPEETYGDYVAFTNGQTIFAFSSTGNNLLYATAYDQAVQSGIPAFDWHQAMIPQADPSHPATVLYGPSFFILSGDPERQQAAWQLLRWLTSTPQAARWADKLAAMPVRASALTVMTDTLAAYPFIRQQTQEILPYARPEPAVVAEFQVREILYEAIISVTLGYTNPQAALDLAAWQVN